MLQGGSQRTAQMNLKHFIFAVGLLVSLAASETKAQTDNSVTTADSSSLASSLHSDEGETSTASASLTTLSPMDPALRFCSEITNYETTTKCVPCDKGEFAPCREGYRHLRNESCEAHVVDTFRRISTVPGCRAVCTTLQWRHKCCHGYYGAKCDNICPGGIKNPCNGHGTCVDTYGFCICEPGFEGKECEQCTNGANCSLADNPCNQSVSPCGAHSHCVRTGPGTHQCICIKGYQKGTRNTCFRVNPCLFDNGDCYKTKECIDQGTPEPKCQCKAGYEEKINGKGCKLKDMCSPGLCGSFADCETKEPLKHSCVCHGGYSWTGEACSGNIIEKLKELSTQDARFKNNIGYMCNMTSTIYNKLLTRYGPFTILVPTDEAFRNAFNDTELADLVNDDVKVKWILNQHILVGQYRTSQYSISHYNLQGNKANFEILQPSINVHGSKNTERSKIIAPDLTASNGVIHLISDVIGLKDNQFEDVKGTTMDLIKNQPEYSTMYSMIRAANLTELFSQPNTTVLITDNEAWSKLSLHDQNYLTSDSDGLANLALILKNHVFPGVIDVTDLINLLSIKSSANIEVKVKISKQGQIQLDNDVYIIRSNIPTSSGLCHQVDKVMVPSYMTPFMKNICKVTETVRVEGPCLICLVDLPCSNPTDEPTGEKKFCFDFFYYPPFDFRFRRSISPRHYGHLAHFSEPWPYGYNEYSYLEDDFESVCAAICLQNLTKNTCCGGFYGPNCIPCPGGYRNPCSGNGECSANLEGTGECSCSKQFAGTSCNQCARKNTFGTSCDKNCTCQFGQCDTGPKGTGKCKPGTCQLGYSGENCDNHLVPCDSDICQANSECFLGEDGIESCYCPPGFEKNEDTCLEIDLCADENSTCHQQATCSQDVPGFINCTCNNGWHGDGFECMPNYPCNGHTDCHRNAVCHNVVPGQHLCVCKTGYRGNGLACTLVDLCLENNGGCHPQAQCTFIKEGERNCTCPELMTGDGVTCRGTIAVEVMKHPRLTKLRELMQVVNPSNMILDTMNTTFTFFAPSDGVLTSFLKSAKTQTTADYWHKEENVLSFLNFHSLYNAFTTDDMLALDGVIRSYPTLYDGFSLRIVNTNKSLHIFANHSKFAVIHEANIPAFNGYFHIIDQVLEPFFPDEQAPSLNDTLSSRPQYQLFYQALKKTKLLETISSLNEYTLFVLSNKNFKQIKRKVTADFLKYYIVPQLIFTPCVFVDEPIFVNTLLGSKHRLVLFNIMNEVFVDLSEVIRSDILTDGGVIHEIEHVLHPTLNRCDLNISTTDLGPCGDCMADNLTCNEGFQSLGSEHIIKYKCHFHKNADEDWETAGCQQICVNYTSDKQCCSGFYGLHCDECPGGAEIPCSGNGICDEGDNGSGRCRCNPGFAGAVCDRCQTTDLVPPYCNISYNSCGYMNGNCSDQAWCNKTNSGVTCQCFSGYVGDGHTCRSLCDGAQNGGCHSQAKCALNVSDQTYQCECNTGFHGNGTWCQQNSDPCTSQNGGCDLERAFCNFTQPKVTDMDEGAPVCECQPGYVGDGKLCSTDLLDAISRIPDLSSFYSWLLAAEKKGIVNIAGLFQDQSKSRTVFVSVSKVMDVTSFLVVDGIFKLPDFSNTEDDIKSNISKGNSKMDDIKQWKLKSLNGQVIDITLNNQGKPQYLVNGVGIVRGNIETLNGVLHLLAAPLASSEDAHSFKSSTGDEATFHSKSLIVGVTVAVLVVLVALLVIVVYKKRGYLCRHPPTNSHHNITFSKINSDGSEDTVSIPDNTQYHNPLYASQNLL